MQLSLWIKAHEAQISEDLYALKSTLHTQKKFKKLLTKKLLETTQIPVFCSLGRKEDNVWIPPSIAWKSEEEAKSHPTSDHIYYNNSKLIQQKKSDFSEVSSEEDLKQIFTIMHSFGIPWDQTNDGCFIRADLVCKILLCMGIPKDKVKKVNCFGENLINNYHFHTAAAVFDENNELWIIDPTLSKENVMKRDAWLERIAKVPKSVQELTVSDIPCSLNPQVLQVVTTPHEYFVLKMAGRINFPPKNFENSIYSHMSKQILTAVFEKFPVFYDVMGTYVQTKGVISEDEPEERDHDIAMAKLKKLQQAEGVLLFPTAKDIRSIQLDYIEEQRQLLALLADLKRCKKHVKEFKPNGQEELTKRIKEKIAEIQDCIAK